MKKLFEKIKSFLKIKVARRILIFLAIFTSIVIVESTVFNYRTYVDRGVKQDFQYSEVVVNNAKDSGSKDEQGKEEY